MTQLHSSMIYLHRQITPLKKNLKSASEKASLKRIHKMRVNLRRIRTMIETLEDLDLSTLTVKEREELCRLWKASGKVSDLHHAENNAGKLHLDTVSIRKKLKESQKVMKGMLKELDPTVFAGIFEKLFERLCESEVSYTPTVLRLKKELSLTIKNLDDVHSFRVAFKKARYVLESSGQDIKNFKYYQNQFGELNELDTLRRFVGKNNQLEKMLAAKEIDCRRIIPLAKKKVFKALSELT